MGATPEAPRPVEEHPWEGHHGRASGPFLMQEMIQRQGTAPSSRAGHRLPYPAPQEDVKKLWSKATIQTTSRLDGLGQVT